MILSLVKLCVIFNLFLVFADEDFIINTSKCKLPNFSAFSEEANLTYQQQDYIKCNRFELLTYTTVINNIAYLHIKNEHKKYYASENEELSCCYSYVTRNGSTEEPDVGIRKSFCQYFNTSVPLYRNTVAVKCHIAGILVYENVHSPITISSPVKRKLKRKLLTNESPISILFIVIDNVSRLNLIRTMPKTRNFLLENGFIEFVGYNKIDDNTFPNFNALLTGLNLTQSNSMCKPTKVGGLDKCPMIWYDFRKAGYVTAYAEDWAPVSTFNYEKRGFKNPPTDYYFKPYIEAAEKLNIVQVESLPYCTGPETEGERILNLAKDFASTFKNQATFGIFWMNTFSHNHINTPSRMDEKVNIFFQDLRQYGIFNYSIVVLLSDHGFRFGEIRTTVQGWYEEKLPLNLISLPSWFKTKFPTKYENFKKNAHRLTSTYDMYMTLQDILEISVQNYTSSPSLACPKCSSLFYEISEDRSCEEAGIPEIWCTCLGRFNKSDHRINNKTNSRAAALVLDAVDTAEYESFESSVTKIVSSSIASVSPTNSYFLIVVEINEYPTYQGLFKINIERDAIQFVELIQLMRIWI